MRYVLLLRQRWQDRFMKGWGLGERLRCGAVRYERCVQ